MERVSRPQTAVTAVERDPSSRPSSAAVAAVSAVVVGRGARPSSSAVELGGAAVERAAVERVSRR